MITIIPKTLLGKVSILLILLMPLMMMLGFSMVDYYDGVSAGDTIAQDIIDRPGVALSMVTSFACGIAAFITGIVSITKKKERSFFVYLSTLIGLVLILFLSAEIIYTH